MYFKNLKNALLVPESQQSRKKFAENLAGSVFQECVYK